MAPKPFVQACTWKIGKTKTPERKTALRLDQHEESVFDDDGRRPVQPADLQPGGKYRAIVKLRMHFEGQDPSQGQWASGTGYLVRKNLLVTAGHCVYDQALGLGRADHIKAYIGYSGLEPSGDDDICQEALGEYVTTPSSWVVSKNRSHDFAFVRLSKSFDNVEPLKYEDTKASGIDELGVVGYPGDKGRSALAGGVMYAEFARVKYDVPMASNLLGYRISTYGGQSGAPVLRKDGDRLVVIGTHVAGMYEMNAATPIGTYWSNPFKEFEKHILRLDPTSDAVGQLTKIFYHNIPQVESKAKRDASISPSLAAWNMAKSMRLRSEESPDSNEVPFSGPIAGPLIALAGTTLGYTAQLSDAVMKQPGYYPKMPSCAGYLERALVAEAALDFFAKAKNGTLNQRTLFRITNRKKTLYNKLQPTVEPIAAELLRNVDPVTIWSIAEGLKKDKPEDDVDPQEVKIKKPDGFDSEDSELVKDFESRLARPAKPIYGDEIFGLLGSAISLGVSLAPSLIKLIPKALSMLSTAISESTIDHVTDADRDKPLTDLATQVILAEATLEACISDDDHEGLEEAGFFDSVRDRVQRIGSLVKKHAPGLINRSLPTVVKLLQAYLDQSKAGSEYPSIGDRVDFRNDKPSDTHELFNPRNGFTTLSSIVTASFNPKSTRNDALTPENFVGFDHYYYADSGTDGVMFDDMAH